MKTSVALIAAVSIAGGAFAAAPAGWEFHGWSRYKPDPQVDVVAGDGGEECRVHGVSGERGMQLMSTNRMTAAKGDMVVISFEAKGKGRVSAVLNHYDASKRWNPPDSPTSRAARTSSG